MQDHICIHLCLSSWAMKAAGLSAQHWQLEGHGAEPKSRIQVLVNSILPSLPDFDPESSPEARLSKAVESNVRFTVRKIHESPEGQVRHAEGCMKVVGAIYDFVTGVVRYLN